MPNSIYLASIVATFISTLFMLFIVSWTILDILTFNLRG